MNKKYTDYTLTLNDDCNIVITHDKVIFYNENTNKIKEFSHDEFKMITGLYNDAMKFYNTKFDIGNKVKINHSHFGYKEKYQDAYTIQNVKYTGQEPLSKSTLYFLGSVGWWSEIDLTLEDEG